jgi:hypothetical protein
MNIDASGLPPLRPLWEMKPTGCSADIEHSVRMYGSGQTTIT